MHASSSAGMDGIGFGLISPCTGLIEIINCNQTMAAWFQIMYSLTCSNSRNFNSFASRRAHTDFISPFNRIRAIIVRQAAPYLCNAHSATLSCTSASVRNGESRSLPVVMAMPLLLTTSSGFSSPEYVIARYAKCATTTAATAREREHRESSFSVRVRSTYRLRGRRFRCPNVSIFRHVHGPNGETALRLSRSVVICRRHSSEKR